MPDAPDRSWPAHPVAGVCIHFSSLPSPLGIGDIGDSALKFVDQLEEMNLHVWQVLPTSPTGFGDSPYQALSAFAGNEMLIGLEPLVREGLLSPEEIDPLRSLPEDSVKFETLIPLKLRLLNTAAERFPQQSSADHKNAYDHFLADADTWWLHDYSLFRALKAHHDDQAWTHWPKAYAKRHPAALKKAAARFRQQIRQVKVLQFFFHRQWQVLLEHARSRGISLMGDIPFYIALDSADAWCERELLQLDDRGVPTHVAGVPPDYFSEDGQLWGNPLYDWPRLKKSDYHWWIRRFEQVAGHFDMVRIDHFRGVESYWSIPFEEVSAKNGEWRPGPGDDFLKAVKKATQGLAIIAEDLGMITDSVVRLRRRHDLPGMRVLQFELIDPKFDPDDIPEDCVCYTGTHDNDTSVGFFSGSASDKAGRKDARKLRRRFLRLSGGSVDSLHHDFIRLAFSTRARVAIAPMQDYLGLGSKARLNEPGTPEGNWRWRMLADQIKPHVRKKIAQLVRENGRVQSETVPEG